MSKHNKLKLGDWNALCDRCGRKFKASQLKKTWDNLYVCKDDWEPRHEQDFLRGVKDDPSVPFTRPDDTVTVCSPNNIAGIAVAGCAIAGNIKGMTGSL